LTPEGNSNYSNIVLNWQPTATLISTVEDKEGVCVFPNPSYGAIHLSFQKELHNVKFEVSDFTGRIVYSENCDRITQGMKNLNISGMPAGTYLLTIHSQESYFTFKLLIED